MLKVENCTNCLMCNNCKDIYDNILKVYNINNFLFDTKNFFVNLDSYPVVRNHILVIPKNHYTSFSNIEIDKSDEIQYIINRISVTFNMSKYIMFEHGTNFIDDDKKICGNSIFHAHLHIIPEKDVDSNTIFKDLKLTKNINYEDFSVENNEDKYFLNVLKYDLKSNNNYLLFINKKKYYCIPEEYIENEITSQFFRKVLANLYNRGVYNWKDNDDFIKNKDLYKLNLELSLHEFKKNDNSLVPCFNVKLVRDNIIDIIKSEGRNVNYYIAKNDEEYEYFLKKKLTEECYEFIESLSISEKNIKEECADVLEVIDNILSLKNIDINDVLDIKNNKNIKNGSFKKRHIYIPYLLKK